MAVNIFVVVVVVIVVWIVQFCMTIIVRDVVVVIYLWIEIDFVVITKGIFMRRFKKAEQMQNGEMDDVDLVITVIEEDQIDSLSFFVLEEFN